MKANETQEVIKVRVVKLTESECMYALDIMREVQNVTQQLGGELEGSNAVGAVIMLQKISHIIVAIEQLMATAVKERLVEELWQRINPEPERK